MQLKNLIKKIKICSIAFVLIFSFVFVQGHSVAVNAKKQTPKSKVYATINDTDSDTTIETENLLLTYNKLENSFVLKDKNNSNDWNSVPNNATDDKIAVGREKMNLRSIFTISYLDTEKNIIEYANTATGCIKADENGNEVPNIQIVTSESSFIVYYVFEDLQIIVPIRFYLKEASMVAEVLTSQIIENSKFRIMTITLLPNFGAGSADEEGYIFIPDGSGAIAEFNNGKSKYDVYQEKVYGRDECFDILVDNKKTQVARLPVFGISKQNGGLLGVITDCDSLAEIKATVNGQINSYSTVCPVFNVRSKYTYTMGESNETQVPETVTVYEDKALSRKNDETLEYDAGSLAVEYFILDKENSDYSAMALKYREYLMEKYKLSTNKSNASLHIEFPGATKTEWKLFGITMHSTETLSSIDDIQSVTDEFLEKGIKSIDVKYTDWSEAQLDDTLLKKADVLSRLGGKSDLKKFASENKDKVSLYLESDFYSVSEWSLFNSKSKNSSQNAAGKAALLYDYEMVSYLRDIYTSPSYLISPLKLNKYVDKYLKSLSKLDNINVSVTDMSEKLASDFTLSGYSRQDSMSSVKKALSSASNERKLMVSGGNEYSLGSADILVNTPNKSSKFNLCDYDVPFYQIALSGIVDYSYSPINFATDSDELFLKSMETGANIHLYFIMQNADKLEKTVEYSKLTSVNPKNWYEKATEYYKGIELLKNKTEGSAIVSHSSLADGVFETRYQNGARVIVNYNSDDFSISGITISGKGYKILSGGDI